MRRLTTAEFVERAKLIHGDAFDYTDTVYMTKRAPVLIRCNTCKTLITVRAGRHLFENTSCATCAGNVKKTTEQFVAESLEVHKDTYDYSKAVYTTRHGLVTIGCRACGIEFEQKACVHLNGSGCSRCNGGVRQETEVYLVKAKLIHGERYDYSRVFYTTAREKIEIGCRRCGTWFKQMPYNHLGGRGCRRCVRQAFVSAKEAAWLDCLGIPIENRQVMIEGLNYNVDALVGLTIYEFYGKYFHGDPRVYAAGVWNKRNKSSMGELYSKTLRREEKLRELGYEVKSVWEVDYDNGLPFSPRYPHECLESIKAENLVLA